MKLRKLMTTLAFAVGFTTVATADAPRTISINFRETADDARAVTGEYGIVPSSSWNNVAGAKNTTGATVNVSDGSTVTVKWSAANTYRWDSATDAALKGYLDDGACGDGTGAGAHIGITGIPFKYYDVIVYLATDQGSMAFNPPSIGAFTSMGSCSTTAYSYDGSTSATRNDASLKFGASHQQTASVGQNVVYLQKDFSYADLDIKGGNNGNSARGGIAAIQIVESNQRLSQKYYNQMAGEDVYVPGGAYDGITVEGVGIKATALTGKTALATSGDGIGGNFNGLYQNGVDVASHTVAGWFKVDTLPDAGQYKLLWSVNNGQEDYGGYAALVGSDGKIYVGRTRNNNDTPTIENYNAKSSKAVVTANQWCHLALGFEKSSSARTATLKVYKNGGSAISFDATSNTGCNGGTTTSKFWVGADGVSVAGFYLDNRVLGDTTTIKALATNPTYNAEKLIPVTYTATMSDDTAWSALVWEPSVPADVRSCDILKVAVTGTPTLTFDAPVTTVANVVFEGAPVVAVSLEDGCWSKTFLTAASFDSADATYAAAPAGYTVDYTATATGFSVRAQNQEVISVNFSNGAGNDVTGDAFTGLYPVKGSTWRNVSQAWSGSRQTKELPAFVGTPDGSTTVERSGIGGTCAANNTYGYTTGVTDIFLKGYLDDGNRAEVTITNIPYSVYDVIVYCATDNGKKFNSVSVNGTEHTCGADGVAVAGTDAWGTAKKGTAAFGVNAMVIKGVTVATLAIKGGQNSNSNRGGIAAVQIINKGTISEKKTFVATVQGDAATFGEITWDKPFEEGTLNEATITVEGDAGEFALTFDNPAVSLNELTIVSSRPLRLAGAAALSGVAQLNLPDVRITYAWPVVALAAGNANVAYAGGTAGDAAVGISHGAAGSVLNLVGGTYKISETHSDVEVTYNVTDSILNYPDCIGLGKGTYNIGGESQINAVKFVLVQGSNNSDVFNLTNDAVVTVSGTSVLDSNQNSVMFGHWPGNSVFTISDNAAFMAADTQILVGRTGGNHTINVNGGTITTKGIKASAQASGTNILNLNGGSLVLGDVGIASYAANRSIAVNVTEDTTITASAATLPISQTINIAAGKTLTIVGAEVGTVVALTGNVTGGGKLAFGENITTVDCGTVRPTVAGAVSFGAGQVLKYTEIITDDGVYPAKWALAEGSATPDYKMFGVDGSEKTVTDGKYTPSVGGMVALYAWEFDGSLASTGRNTDAMKEDHGPFYTDGNDGVYAYSQPWKNLTWPTEFTTMIACTLPTNANVCLVGWGQATPGGIALVSGDVSKNEVKMVYWQNNQAYTELTSMTVPNAYDCEHLYLITKTADSVQAYVDGSLVASYSGALSLGLGVQIGTVYQGVGNTGLVRLDTVYTQGTNQCKSVVNAMRIYDAVLGPNAIAALKAEFPYESPNGSYSRALDGTGNQWVAEDAWAKQGELFDAPAASSTVELSAAADAEVAVNLEASANYEALNLSGEGEITISAADDNAHKITCSGLVKIGANATVDYSAADFAGTPIQILTGKTLTIDASMVDLTKYFVTTAIPLTGLVTADEATDQLVCTLPDATAGRTVEFRKNASNNTYELVITVEAFPFVYNNGWTWNGGEVSAETVSNNTAVAIESAADLLWPIDRSTIAVNGGTFTVEAVTRRAAAVTVAADAVLDLNGKNAREMAITLAGGKVTYGDTQPAAEGDQIKVLTLTEDSEINTSVKGQIYAASYATATTIALGESTLTKTGADVLQVVNVDITGAATVYVKEGEFYGSEDTRAGADVTFKIGAGATLHNRVGKTMTLPRIVGEGGTLNNEGTISGFELSGTLTIANAGAYGTITNMEGTVVNIGQKRGLTFAGAGTVNAVVTDAEIRAGNPIAIFIPAEDATVVGKVFDEDGDEVPGSFAGGVFTVTYGAKNGTTYYLTLAEALEGAADGDTVELLKAGDAAVSELTKNITLAAGAFALDVTADAALTNDLVVTGTGALAITGPLAVAATLDLSAIGYAQTAAGCTGGFDMAATGKVVLPAGVSFPEGKKSVNSAEAGAQLVAGDITLTYDGTDWYQPVTGIQLGQAAAEVAVGQSVTLTATVTPSEFVPAVEWTSEDEGIATVDASGVVQGVSSGTVTIKATCGGLSATCEVTVKASGPQTPETGGGSIEAVPGEDGVYEATPSPEGNVTIVPGTLGDEDIIRIVVAEDVMITGVPAEQIEVKRWGCVIPGTALVGGDAEGFSTALDEGGYADVEGEQISVQPALTEPEDETKPLVMTDTEVTIGFKTIPGLTYQLLRSETVGGEFQSDGDAQRAGSARLTLTSQKNGQTACFYKILVTK